jgi:hypothetical protein
MRITFPPGCAAAWGRSAAMQRSAAAQRFKVTMPEL